MKSEWYKQIEEFHRGMIQRGQPVKLYETPTMGTIDERILRASLILEEAIETITKGLGVSIRIEDRAGHQVLLRSDADHVRRFEAIDLGSLAEVYDGVCDSIVVNLGTLVAFGIPDNPGMEMVNQNNLLKLATGHLNEIGKFVKAPNHPKPDFQQLLRQLGHIVD